MLPCVLLATCTAAHAFAVLVQQEQAQDYAVSLLTVTTTCLIGKSLHMYCMNLYSTTALLSLRQTGREVASATQADIHDINLTTAWHEACQHHHRRTTD